MDTTDHAKITGFIKASSKLLRMRLTAKKQRERLDNLLFEIEILENNLSEILDEGFPDLPTLPKP
jgi:hypothetical protein